MLQIVSKWHAFRLNCDYYYYYHCYIIIVRRHVKWHILHV